MGRARVGCERHHRLVRRVPERPRPRVDAMGLAVDDVYVFGSGMDYRGYWRELRGIYAAAEEPR